ncbi:MAG: ATP-binding cassette domain-containing protein [Oscillospiraceae bacterium]|jgi:NHLM bacteriocin system ABC transporter ATP-binding protein|nr:ATP-binding cassette domain-containing protein [Oscillospiraceae bacterium]
MAIYNDQIKQRIKADEEQFYASFETLASAVTGKTTFADDAATDDAIAQIFRFYRLTMPVVAREERGQTLDFNERLNRMLSPSGIMRRDVDLSGAWYKDGAGAMLGRGKNGEVIALIPAGLSGYKYTDRQSGKTVKIDKKEAANIDRDAICFYKPFPQKKLSIPDLLKYILGMFSVADFVSVAATTLAVTLIGLLSPYVNKVLFSDVINSADKGILFPAAFLLIGVTLSTSLIGITRSMVMSRLNTKMGISVQAAAMMRVLSLPPSFFKSYGAGEFSSRTSAISSLCSILAGALLTAGLSTLFSLIYIGQIFTFAPALVIPALIIIAVTLVFSVLNTFVQMNISKKSLEQSSKVSGLVFAFLSGIQKIRLAGAERRVFAKLAEAYAKPAKFQYNPPFVAKYSAAISLVISSVGSIAIYVAAVKSGVSMPDYMAFSVSYGMVAGAFMSLSGIVSTFANIRPILNLVKPLFDKAPETSSDKPAVSSVSGALELNNISFRYTENTPLVLEDFTLKIRRGQYIAIVGRTGCGKSTLMRLLLGFETPQKGAVYYDGRDISSVDIKSLRRNIGVVMQDGKLFSGSVYDNIVISAPWLTVDEAWEAAVAAGIADDIRAMPMGMHTMISEVSGGVSGGQRQRLMIARAVAPNPKILMLDEATSVLDNITQKQVMDALGKLKCTRLVIAHRLSTIKQCDRIVYLNGGHIIEDGTYDELIAKNGAFAELVRRQQLDG